MRDPRRVCAVVLSVATAVIAAAPAQARVFLTREQALDLAFGGQIELERESVFMTETQLARARGWAGDGVEIESALVTRYVAQRDGALVGTAYFDTHRVRTLQETVMIVVGPTATVEQVEILSFDEPQEYLPKDGWLAQFDGKRLDSELDLRRRIHGMTGATLSAQAVTDATRRILAIHRAVTAAASEDRR